jgi:hypothetical protein
MNENDKPPKTEFRIVEIKPSVITSQVGGIEIEVSLASAIPAPRRGFLARP